MKVGKATGRFTLLGTVAQLSGGHQRGLQFGSPGRPRELGRAAAPEQMSLIAERLDPVFERLNTERAAWFDRAERNLRLKAGGTALAGLVLGWSMGGPLLGLAMMAGAAAFVIILLFGQSQGNMRELAKQAVLTEIAPVLVELISVPPVARTARFSPARMESWGLFRNIHTVTVDECLTGTRDGHEVSVARVGVQFGNQANRKTEIGGGLCFVIAEVARNSGKDEGMTLVVPEDAGIALRAGLLVNRPAQVSTDDAAFGARYRVFGDPAPLGPAARAAFAAIEAVTRADRTATQEVSSGSGLSPIVVITATHLRVLTPLALFDGAFEPPPFWEPMVPDPLIPAFVSDLFILNDHLSAALALTKGLSR